jgi:hypothetical protein
MERFLEGEHAALITDAIERSLRADAIERLAESMQRSCGREPPVVQYLCL